MKKLLTIGLTLFLSTALLSGCGQSSTGTASDTNTAAGSSQAASDTNASGENTDDIFIWEGTVIEGLTEKGKTADEIIIPDNATSIAPIALSFADMTKLTIGANVELIGRAAFDSCKSLQEITIPSSVKVIEKNAFNSCEDLEKATFSEGLEEIGEKAFWGTAIESIVLPEGLITIGDDAFNICNYTTSIYLPASLENIPAGSIGLKMNGSTIYVKEDSWADTHFDEYAKMNSNTNEPVSPKAYY